MVGGWFAATFTEKLELAVREPSLTRRVIVAAPDLPGAGVTVTVRVAPLPCRTMPLSGKRLKSDDIALTVSLAAAVCASSTVKESGPVLE